MLRFRPLLAEGRDFPETETMQNNPLILMKDT